MITSNFFKKVFAVVALMIAAISANTVSAADSDVILRAAASFDTLVLTGDVTVEIDYSDTYAGYIVYKTDNADSPRLKCHNDDNVLVIEGTKSAFSVVSRVRVVCATSLTSIINTGSGRVIIPRDNKNIKSLSLTNTGSGDIGLRKFKGDALDIINTGSGRVGIKQLSVSNLNVVNSGSGAVFARGKASDASLVDSGTGDIVVFRLKAARVDAVASGQGSIKCRYKDSLKAAATSFGDIIYYSKNGKPGKNISAIESRAGNGKPHIYPSDFKKK